MELGDNNLGGVDADRDGGTVGLLAVNALNVDDPLATVDLDNLALTALVGAANNQNLIILADGDGTDLLIVTTNHTVRYTVSHCRSTGRKKSISLLPLERMRTLL